MSARLSIIGSALRKLTIIGLFFPACCYAQRGPALSGVNPFLTEGMVDQGWPFIRGANCDGHSGELNLADAWPANGPPVLWTRPLGQGYSGFVAWDNRVATQYQTLAGQFVVCLNADTGDVVWQHW